MSQLKKIKTIGIVYIATNTINGKQNVGQTIKKLKTRIKNHKCCKSSLLGRALLKYGDGKFIFIKINCESFEEMDKLERYWIKQLNTIVPNGYNITNGGHNQHSVHLLTRKKIAIKATGRIPSEKTRKIWSQQRKGKKLTQDHINNISKSLLGKYTKENNTHFGKHLNQDHKNKISKALKGRISPMKGKKHPKEWTELMSQKMSGENNPMHGKSVYEVWVEKYGREIADEKRKKNIIKMKENHTGKYKTRTTLSNARKVILISPNGQEYILPCYHPFCKDQGLLPSGICQVLRGKKKHYKGWTGRYLSEL